MTDSSQTQIHSRKSPPLDPEAKQALGKVKPELAWLQVGTVAFGFAYNYDDLAFRMAQEMGLEGDLEELDVAMQLMDPVHGINQLYQTQTDLNWRDINHQPGVKVLEAVIRMFINIDRMNRL